MIEQKSFLTLFFSLVGSGSSAGLGELQDSSLGSEDIDATDLSDKFSQVKLDSPGEPNNRAQEDDDVELPPEESVDARIEQSRSGGDYGGKFCIVLAEAEGLYSFMSRL